MTPEQKIAELQLVLPPAPRPMGTYVPLTRVESLVFLSGHGPLLPDKSLIIGKVGRDLTREQGYAAARATGLALLATLRKELGSLDKVSRVVKLFGMVNATPDFTDHPAVINGCSDLFREIFGEAGVGARSAVGMSSLPSGIATEIEGVFEVT